MRLPFRLVAALGAALLLSAAGLHRLPPVQAQSGCVVADTGLDAEERAALDAINAARAAEGLGPLSLSPALMRAARWKSSCMASGAPFAHDDPSRGWLQRLADCGYSARAYVAENIAAGTGTAPETVTMWLNSPAHRANMLDAGAQTIGIARARGGEWGWYWTADFGVADGEQVAANQGRGGAE